MVGSLGKGHWGNGKGCGRTILRPMLRCYEVDYKGFVHSGEFDIFQCNFQKVDQSLVINYLITKRDLNSSHRLLVVYKPTVGNTSYCHILHTSLHCEI
jgi:hypothetical protein